MDLLLVRGIRLDASVRVCWTGPLYRFGMAHGRAGESRIVFRLGLVGRRRPAAYRKGPGVRAIRIRGSGSFANPQLYSERGGRTGPHGSNERYGGNRVFIRFSTQRLV